MHGRIDRNHRRGLRRPIPLQHAHAVLVRIQPPRLVPQLLGTRKNVTDAVHVIRIRKLAIRRQKRVGPEHDRRARFIDQFRHNPVVQGARIIKRFDTVQYRQQRAARQPERMKHRQHIQHDIPRPEIHPARDLAAIGQNIRMAQHHAFRRAFRPRRIKDHRRRIRLATLRPVTEPRQQRLRHARRLIKSANAGAQIFQIHHLHTRRAQRRHALLQFPDRNKPSRRQYNPHLRHLTGLNHLAAAGRKIQHRRDFSRPLQSEKHNRRHARIRQHHPHIRLSRIFASQHAAQNETPHKKLPVCQRLALHILRYNLLGPMHIPCRQQRGKQRLPVIRAVEHHLAHHIIQLQARHLPPPPARDPLRDRKLMCRQHRHRDFGKPAPPHLALQPRKIRVLRAINPNRQQFRAGFVGDHPGPLINLHQRAGLRQPPLGKHHALFIALQMVDQRLCRQRVRRVHRQRVHHLQ